MQSLRPFEPVPRNSLDSHFALQPLRRVPTLRPLTWLRLGWQDLRANPALSIGYGCAFALVGWLILLLTAPRPYLVTAAVSGFMLVAPFLVAGLYEISRRRGKGHTSRFVESLDAWRRNGHSMSFFGMLLAFVAIFWERLSAIVFALFYGGDLASLDTFVRTILLSGQYWAFLVAYVAAGALLAGTVFAASVIAVPMLVDRDVDVGTAVAQSLKAVEYNLGAMAFWAVLLTGLTILGFLTALMGMIVLLPWMAHASWHAYRDLTQA